MSDPVDRAAVRRRAQERAERMGFAVRPDTAQDTPQTAPEPLPTGNPAVLRQMLRQGRLTDRQAAQVRTLFAAVSQYATNHPEGD